MRLTAHERFYAHYVSDVIPAGHRPTRGGLTLQVDKRPDDDCDLTITVIDPRTGASLAVRADTSKLCFALEHALSQAADRYAPRPRTTTDVFPEARDRHGIPLKPGDRAECEQHGELRVLDITAIHVRDSVPHLHGTVTCCIPAATARRLPHALPHPEHEHAPRDPEATGQSTHS